MTDENIKSDHDLLVKLSTEMALLRDDVREIKDGTKIQLKELYNRSEMNEKSIANLQGWRTGIVVGGSAIIFVICSLVAYIYVSQFQLLTHEISDVNTRLIEHINSTTVTIPQNQIDPLKTTP